MTFSTAERGTESRWRTARRWLINLGLALLGTAGLTVVSVILGASWADSWSADPMGFFLVTTFLTFMYFVLAPALVSLVGMELLARARTSSSRGLAIALAACAGAGYSLVVFGPRLAVAPPLFLFAVAGAAYGALIRFPQAAAPSDIAAH